MKLENGKHLVLLKSPARVDEKAFDEILIQAVKDDEAAKRPDQVPTSIFDNRKRWIKAQDVARELGISVRTVYDWHHRPHRRNTPPGLFSKFNGHLFLSTEALNLWMTQQATRPKRR